MIARIKFEDKMIFVDVQRIYLYICMNIFLIYLYRYSNFDPFPLLSTKTNLICDENTLMRNRICLCTHAC